MSGTSSNHHEVYPGPPTKTHPLAGPCLVQALAGQVLNGKKGSLCDIHESCDTNIKAPSWTVTIALRLLDLALFLQQEHRGSTRLKAPLRLCGALQLAPRFLSRFIRGITVVSCPLLGCAGMGSVC